MISEEMGLNDALITAGIMPVETDLGEFGAWHETERLVPNLHRAYAELRGEAAGAPLDYPTTFGEMIAYNGSPIRCCA